jgi:hypothetical protein
METGSDKPNTQDNDDMLVSLLGENVRVAVWASRNNIKLASDRASHEAVAFVRSTATTDFYVMYFDFSKVSNHPARLQAIQSYLQAMRTAVSRMRAAIRKSHTQRRLREFGIRLIKVDQVAECPGLWRVEIDSSRNEGRSEVKALIDDAVFMALTSETERSMAMPTITEQKLALKRRGVI